ncbi:carboxypeptidase-like regulatory domain-containing protein [Kordia sp. YSTF-M3]|uniref:Carboxypeptidase-like regulatory domain-containing protein n=1 Tax=Kordia aestuariivivens TaxID=2759037 RepID=A0ABR7Q619_9FLAO|nr:carboxypeptidase-like regulatory domain-containing protein [Kordia aestuariivivens]MBC8753967.1 carboxypeptidase-like regulatory domain-containing protein [Kordia aestuariivivens]
MSQFNINSACTEYSTTVSITGQVFDAVTKETLPFANVYVTIDTTIGTAANEDGIFSIDVPDGTTLTVSFTGYHAFKFEATRGFTKVFLTPDDQLDTVYLEHKKKNNNWLWWLLFGGLAVSAMANSEEKPKRGMAGSTTIKAKI